LGKPVTILVTVAHISDHDLARYYLGMMRDNEAELAPLEEHLLMCEACVDRAEDTQDYVDVMRVGLMNVGR
jgi:hypothetical protein